MVIPSTHIKSILTFIIKSIYPVDGGTFMVSSEKEEVLWIFDLVRKQQADGLQRLLASVYIVSKKQVVALWRISSILKKPEQVIILTMNITCRKRNSYILF